MTNNFARTLFISFVLILLFLSASLYSLVQAFPSYSETRGLILYVKSNGYGNCTSWSSACGLQTALYQAGPGTQIWVAAGTYKPSVPTNREATFQMESGVEWYGGFPVNGGNWTSRNWQANPTILSGDIGITGDNSDNSYHVVTGNEVDETAVLDGFTIRDGNANGGYSNENGYGGGMYLYKSSPKLINLIFMYNLVDTNGGGGMYNRESNPSLINIEFSHNTASRGGEGAGLYNYKSNPTLNNIKFSNNSANHGGGMYSDDSNPILNDVTFTSNYANSSGGGMYNHWYSSPVLTNVVFSYNSSGYDAFSGWGGGGMANAFDSSPTLNDVVFYGNWTKGSGGALSGGSNSILEDVGFYFNRAEENCGAVCDLDGTLTNVIIHGNTAEEGYGGGMCAGDDSILNNVEFSYNEAYLDGGGLYNYGYYGDPILNDVLFYGNSARSGGGMSNDGRGTTLTNVLFAENSASDSGGGLYNSFQDTTLTNVTFSGNSAASTGGGIFNESAKNIKLINTTFFENSALYGGGISNYESTPDITNSVIWGNTPDQVYNNLGSAMITYSDIQYGYVGTGNINLNPLLGSLKNNGGITTTHALGTGSPAIDAGDPGNCPSTDQRGFPRPFDGDNNGIAVCDMGAYEWQTAILTLEIIGGGDVLKSPDKLIYSAGEAVSLTAISNYDWIFSSWSGDVSSRKNPLKLNVIGDMNITANFVEVLERVYLPIINK